MKNVWPLLVVGLLALGIFSLMSFDENSATGGYFTPKYYSQPPVLGPRTSVMQVQMPAYVPEEPLDSNTCVLAREIARVESLHGIPASDDLSGLIMYCDSKGW